MFGPVRTLIPPRKPCRRVFVGRLGTAPHFGSRSDQGTDLASRPIVEAGLRIKRDTPGPAKGRPLGTHAGELCQRFRGARKTIGIRHIFGCLGSSQKTIPFNRPFHNDIHQRLTSLRRIVRPCQGICAKVGCGVAVHMRSACAVKFRCKHTWSAYLSLGAYGVLLRTSQ
jgi:hypothetical protein